MDLSALLTTLSALNINRPGAAHPFRVPLSYTNLPFLSPALCSLGSLGPLTLLSCPCPFSSYLTPPPTIPLSFSGLVPSLIAAIKSFSSVIPCGHVLITFMRQRQCFACRVMDTTYGMMCQPDFCHSNKTHEITYEQEKFAMAQF